MEKRYQVFVSSTYSDLEDERKRVIQTLIELDCIPAGMELFPAIDEEQFLFISKIIDDCDYYIIILGGRYGTITEDGISYTEKEFDYAVSRNMRVIALVHGSPESLPFTKVDASEEARKKLKNFREKVCVNRLVKFWQDAKELPGLVALSLPQTIKRYPAQGWTRGGQESNSELLQQINELRIENAKLQKELDEAKEYGIPLLDGLSSGDEKFEYKYNYSSYDDYGSLDSFRGTGQISWDEAFSILGAACFARTEKYEVKERFSSVLRNRIDADNFSIPDEYFDTLIFQLHALGLIEIIEEEIKNSNSMIFISITKHGRDHLMRMKTIKKVSNLK